MQLIHPHEERIVTVASAVISACMHKSGRLVMLGSNMHAKHKELFDSSEETMRRHG